MIYVPRQTLMDNVDTDEELRLYRRGWPLAAQSSLKFDYT